MGSDWLWLETLEALQNGESVHAFRVRAPIATLYLFHVPMGVDRHSLN